MQHARASAILVGLASAAKFLSARDLHNVVDMVSASFNQKFQHVSVTRTGWKKLAKLNVPMER